MYAMIISYGLHLLSAVIFFILLPLPFLVKGMEQDGRERLTVLFRFYKSVLVVAHGALVFAFITGLWMYFNLASLWLWSIIIVWVALGAFLGVTLKNMRLSQEAFSNQEDARTTIAKVKRFSIFLSVAIVVMFVLKAVRYI
ncbi:hypothetical protein [Desertibacillus haloalkaliphilus]|uniref:hypothetical protein n=1 Tax=Desertibacillus haloalkaliphilus TaxID=1328930 RepID=UPI001C2713EE|nr:hypothetical protein [Desertibacillus haloalkaliphilus]MBU8907399.1 hypothetical protein [Desertibacillus haloalkaliphilus]